MKIRGIDVSHWQGNFNFAIAKFEGFDFVIIKGGGGDAGLYKDSSFEKFYSEAKSSGMMVGAYWFSKALNIAEAEKEADYFYNNILKGKQFELPIYIDVENKEQLALGKRALTDIIKAFCTRLESYGYWVGIYSSLYNFKDFLYDEELQNYAHWIAQWASRCDYPNKEILGVWQYGGEVNYLRSNKVAGVICDQDFLYIDYAQYIKEKGLNGYGELKPELKKDLSEETIYHLQSILKTNGYNVTVNGKMSEEFRIQLKKFVAEV